MRHVIESYDTKKGRHVFVGIYDDVTRKMDVHRESRHLMRKYNAFGIGHDALVKVQGLGGGTIYLYVDGRLKFPATVERWLKAPAYDESSGLQHFLGSVKAENKPDFTRLSLTHPPKAATV